jgi:hypothetical protein
MGNFFRKIAFVWQKVIVVTKKSVSARQEAVASERNPWNVAGFAFCGAK